MSVLDPKHIPSSDDNIPGMLRTLKDRPAVDPLGIKDPKEIAQAEPNFGIKQDDDEENQPDSDVQFGSGGGNEQQSNSVTFGSGGNNDNDSAVNFGSNTNASTSAQQQNFGSFSNQPQDNKTANTTPATTEETIGSNLRRAGQGIADVAESVATESTLFPGSTAAEFIGAGLAKNDLGDALGLNNADKKRKRIEQNQQALSSMAEKQLAEAKQSGDKEKIKKAKQKVKMLSGVDTDPYEKAVEGERRSAASAITDAVSSAIGGLGAKGVMKTVTNKFTDDAARVLSKLDKGNKISKTAGRVGSITDKYIPGGKFLNQAAKWAQKTAKEQAPKYLREGIYGATFDAYIRSNHPDASTEDIVEGAERGLKWGVGTLAALGGGGAILSKVGSEAKKPIRKGIQKIEEKAAKTLEKKPNNYDTVIDKVLDSIGEERSMKEVGASAFLKSVNAARQFKTRWYDRYQPFKRVEDKLRETLGRDLKDEEKLWRDLRLGAGVPASNAERRFDDLANKLRPFDDIQDEGVAYATQLDYIDRAKLGNEVPTGESLDTLKKELELMVDEIGNENMSRVGKMRRTLNNATTKNIERLKNSGIISEDEFVRLKRSHPNYLPHNVIGQEGIDQKVKEVISDSVDVNDNTLEKAVGSTKNIENPIAGIKQQIEAVENAAYQNDIMKRFAKLNDEVDDLVPGMKKVKNKSDVGDEFGTISFFEDGQKQIYQVPKDIAESVKGKPVDPGPITKGAVKMAEGAAAIGGSQMADILRGGATTYNPGFIGTNFARDRQAGTILWDSMIKEMKDRYGVKMDGFVDDLDAEKLNQMYDEHGIFGADIFKDGDDWVRAQMENTGMLNDISDKAKKPAEALKKVNEEIEKSTRLKGFRRALEAGLDPKDAAMVARDATIDFQKMGTAMRPLNKVIPFLNARVQGTANMIRGAKNAPHTFGRNMMRLAGYPTMALHEWNNQFKSYKNFSRRQKDGYWNIIVGEEKAKDNYNGEDVWVPQTVQIRKSEIQQMFSNPLRWALESQEQQSYRQFSEMMGDTLAGASPVSAPRYQNSNMLMSLVSQSGPVPTAVVGLASNKHPYFGGKIVPDQLKDQPAQQQFTDATPETSKEISKQLSNIFNLDISPARINFTLQSLGGGLSSDLQEGVDLMMGAWGGKLKEDVKKKAKSNTAFGYAASMPVVDQVITEPGEYYSEGSEFQRRQTQAIQEKVDTKKLQESRETRDIFETMIQKGSEKKQEEYLRSLNLSKSEREDIQKLKSRRMTVDGLDKSTDTEVRARVIQHELEEMKANGVGDQKQGEYLSDLRDKDLLTPKVSRIMELLQQNPELQIDRSEIPQRPQGGKGFSNFLPTTGDPASTNASASTGTQ